MQAIEKLKEEKDKTEKEIAILKNYHEKERKFREEEIKFLVSVLYELRCKYEELKSSSNGSRMSNNNKSYELLSNKFQKSAPSDYLNSRGLETQKI